MLGLGGEWHLDSAAGELRHRDQHVELGQTALRVLEYLIERREHFVSTQELLDRVWSDTVVGPAAVATAVKQIRRAFGDPVSHPSWIESRRGRGYRFIGLVAAVPSTTPATSIA